MSDLAKTSQGEAKRRGPKAPARWPIQPEDLILSPEDDDLRNVSARWRACAVEYGYPQGWIKGRGTVFMHWLVIERMIGRRLKRGETVDHIDGCRQNNRRENLRVASYSVNRRNMHGRDSDRKTPGPRCVYPTPNGKRWIVVTTKMVDGKTRTLNLGTYDTVEEAQAVYENYRASLPGYIPPEKSNAA